MARKAIKHPTSCRGFTVRYQWVLEMCGYRRTEADIVGVLMGFTEKSFEASGNGKKEGWEITDISMALLSRMSGTSIRATQVAVRWLEDHKVVKSVERKGQSGINLRRGYALDLDLLDEVSERRDAVGAPVQIIRLESGNVTIAKIDVYGRSAATGVQKRLDTTMVQKLQGDGAETAGDGAETAPPTVQKLQGTRVQKRHPSYNGLGSLEDGESSIPALAIGEGDPSDQQKEDIPDESEDLDSIGSSLKRPPDQGYRPDRKISSLPPLESSRVQLPKYLLAYA